MITATPSQIACVAATPSISPGVTSPANSRNTSPRRWVSMSAVHSPERTILTLVIVAPSDDVFANHTVDVKDKVRSVRS